MDNDKAICFKLAIAAIIISCAVYYGVWPLVNTAINKDNSTEVDE